MLLDLALETQSNSCASPTAGVLTNTVAGFSCAECSATFASTRALSTHTRAKHGQRTVLRNFVDGSGVCLVCRVTFSNRLRVIAHVSKKRCRGKATRSCRDVLLSGVVPELDSSRVERLDASDAILRREAKRRGRSHPTVLVRASRSKIRSIPDVSVETCKNELSVRRLRLKRKTRASESVILELPQQRRQQQRQQHQHQPMHQRDAKRRRLRFKQVSQ